MAPTLSYIEAPTLNGRTLAPIETLREARRIDSAQRRAYRSAFRRMIPGKVNR